MDEEKNLHNQPLLSLLHRSVFVHFSLAAWSASRGPTEIKGHRRSFNQLANSCAKSQEQIKYKTALCENFSFLILKYNRIK